MANQGYVKLPRDILARKWANDANTMNLYLFLLTNAAFKDFEYKGMIIHNGEFVTSVDFLSKRLKQTTQQIRTRLKRLVSTNDITISATRQHSVIKLISEVGDLKSNTIVDSFVNNQADNQINNVRRSKEAEVKKEEIKKEEEREEAAAPRALSDDKNSSFKSQSTALSPREELVIKYGESRVREYEIRFNNWAMGKNVRAPLYPTIEKWLASDFPRSSIDSDSKQAPPKNKNAAGGINTVSSINLDSLKRQVMAQYLKPGSGKADD